MIKLEKTQIVGWEPAIRGMRNPMNSWEKSDTVFCDWEMEWRLNNSYDEYPCTGLEIGPNDLELMKKLAKAGSEHAKYRRMIVVYCDIVAPLYWWKEFDTYKVGTVANSCSTMHKIHERPLTLEDFSIENVDDTYNDSYLDGFRTFFSYINEARENYLETNNKKYWYTMIQLLPSSYNQRRTVMMNYEVLANIYSQRKGHKLDEWREFCAWIKNLPYAKDIITMEDN